MSDFQTFSSLRCALGAFNNLVKLRIDLEELKSNPRQSELDKAYIAKKEAEVLIATLTLKVYLQDVKDLSVFSI
jgi:hypothetical protein